MTTTQPNANPAQGAPAGGAEDPQERRVIDLMKKAYTEILAEQEQTRTNQPPPEKSFLEKLFG